MFFCRYAEAGKVIAGHLSVVDAGTSLYGVCYSTIRDPVTENATIQFIHSINFTGFGAVWWWQGVDNKLGIEKNRKNRTASFLDLFF